MGIVKDFWQEPTFVELMLPMQEASCIGNINSTNVGSCQKSLTIPIESKKPCA